MAGATPAVFLDRDNTLIANDGDLGDPERVALLNGVAEGLARLRRAGFRLVVVSNQSGVARGVFTEPDVHAVNRRIAELADAAAGRRGLIEAFYYCPHHEDVTGPCRCRKPEPGMLVDAARDLGLDLARSWMVGDQPRDVQAGRAAGCRTILVSAEPAAAGAGATVLAATFTEAVVAICDSSISNGR